MQQLSDIRNARLERQPKSTTWLKEFAFRLVQLADPVQLVMYLPPGEQATWSSANTQSCSLPGACCTWRRKTTT